MNLILLEPSEVDDAGAAVLSGRRARHAAAVLRAAPGRTLRVGRIDGPLGEATVTRSGGGELALSCRFEPVPPPRAPVDLLLALPRPKAMKRLWAPLAAMGVDRLLLSNADRVERMYFDTHVLDPAFRRALLLEGLEQARDTRLPEVTIHRRLKVLIEDDLDALGPRNPRALRLLADPGADAGVGERIRAAAPERVLLAVGPEGGWTGYERDLFARHGFEPAGLGPRPLRSDTACIALLAVAHEALREAARGAGRPPEPA